MDKVFIAQAISTRTIAAEAALDQAIAEASQLVTEMIQAREKLGVSAKLGGVALSKVSQSLSTLVEARSVLVEAHEQMAQDKLRLGIRTKMAGSVPDEISPDHTLEIRRAS